MLSSRYYFVLFEVDAPIKQRYLRFKKKYPKQDHIDLEDFIDLDDQVCHKKSPIPRSTSTRRSICSSRPTRSTNTS